MQKILIMENSFNIFQSIAERRIEQAKKTGCFDNLPGQGKPLTIEDTSNIPEDLRMAYKILKNSGYIPPELAQRHEITRLVDMLDECKDTQEKLKQMQKIRFMIMQAKMRHNHSIELEDNDPYYSKILDKLESKS